MLLGSRFEFLFQLMELPTSNASHAKLVDPLVAIVK